MMARKFLSVLGALGLLAGGLGCEAEPVSIQILQMQSVSTTTCQPTADPVDSLALGTVDLALATNYVAFPLVRNNMADINTIQGFNTADRRVPTLDVVLREAVVEYGTLGPITADLPPKRVIPLAGTVRLGSSSALGIELLDAATLQAIRQAPEFLVIDSQSQVRPVRTEVTMTTKLVFRGVTVDGRELETNEFFFPLRICNGCMVTYPPEAISTGAGAAPNCLAIDPEEDDRDPPECPGRVGSDDFFVDCRDCQGFAVDSLARSLCQPPTGL
jgi:hypothetical protein